MNTEQAWDHFVRQVMNVAGGIEEPTRAIAAGKLYAAACVTEARAPLVEALEPLASVSRFTDFNVLPSEEEWAAWASLILGAAAALAKGEDE